MDRTLELLRTLSEAHGVPGQEGEVRKIVSDYLAEVSNVSTDGLGSLIGEKAGSSRSPKIMVAGHLDEIGFMVTMITDDGFIKFQTLGGWWEQVMLAQRVTVRTRKGDYTGVIGSKPPHILSAEARKKPVEKKDMFIDIGVASKEEALEAGVRPGDPIIPICPFTPMANEKYLMGKALDNRAGCAVVIEVLQALQNQEHPNTVYGVGTVQEEVGLRGAQTSTNLVEPDVAFAVDTGIAGDSPGIKPEEAQSKLGEGPTITLFDASMVPHTKLRDLVVDTAEASNIPYQFDLVPGGGTDAGRIHLFGKGVPTLAISMPVRYIHSHASVMHREDFDNTVKLMIALIRRLDQATVDSLKY